MSQEFLNQGHAEDMVNRNRFLYYVKGEPVLSDGAYDALEDRVKKLWEVSCVTHEVGSSNMEDYAPYIREGRRPLEGERRERDARIAERWMKAL